jgi:DNA-binding NarL/FixJ family response regulator
MEAMAERKKIRVLIVDDHPVVRFGIAAIVGSQADMLVAGEANTGEEACELCRTTAADVVLMDLRLPGMTGVDAITVIRKTSPDLRFIVLTTYDGDEDIFRALAAGAQSYMLKAMSHVELANAIRKVHAGLKFLPENISRALTDRTPGSELSPRELQVLNLIVEGLSNREIGDALGISEATVKWHVNIILSRLQVTDRTQATVAALKRGIVHLS